MLNLWVVWLAVTGKKYFFFSFFPFLPQYCSFCCSFDNYFIILPTNISKKLFICFEDYWKSTTKFFLKNSGNKIIKMIVINNGDPVQRVLLLQIRLNVN